MSDQPQSTKGGPLNVKEEHVTGHISDAELHEASIEPSSDEEQASGQNSVNPVESFDPPLNTEERSDVSKRRHRPRRLKQDECIRRKEVRSLMGSKSVTGPSDDLLGAA
jgi:hypothetical protein